jgi:hypothetical protein
MYALTTMPTHKLLPTQSPHLSRIPGPRHSLNNPNPPPPDLCPDNHCFRPEKISKQT